MLGLIHSFLPQVQLDFDVYASYLLSMMLGRADD